MPDVRILEVDHRRAEVAAGIHAVQIAAYTQEARLLGARQFPPLASTIEDIERSDERFIAAFIGEVIVGAASVEPGEMEAAKWSAASRPAQRAWSAPHVHIASLVVAPPHQRQGIGRRLIEAVLNEHGTGIVTVSTAAANLPAIALYAGLGFLERGRRVIGVERLELVLLHRDPTSIDSSS